VANRDGIRDVNAKKRKENKKNKESKVFIYTHKNIFFINKCPVFLGFGIYVHDEPNRTISTG
jgi:hypothetical protein